MKDLKGFHEYFGKFNSRFIGEFILDAIKNRQIYKLYDGDSPGAKSYVYKYGRNYLKLIIDGEGEIVTAFPSETYYF